MSVNRIFDIIEDTIIGELEVDVDLPDSFTIWLEPDQFKAMMKYGLVNSKTGQPIMDERTTVGLTICDRLVIVRSDVDPEPWSEPS
jgi:hypothetical protein